MADEQATITFTPPIKDDVNSPASLQVQPGEQTTEHAMACAQNLQALIIKLLGIVMTVGGTVADLGNFFPQNQRTLHILQVAGVVTAAAAQLKQAFVTGNYIQGRSIVKSAAAELLIRK